MLVLLILSSVDAAMYTSKLHFFGGSSNSATRDESTVSPRERGECGWHVISHRTKHVWYLEFRPNSFLQAACDMLHESTPDDIFTYISGHPLGKGGEVYSKTKIETRRSKICFSKVIRKPYTTVSFSYPDLSIARGVTSYIFPDTLVWSGAVKHRSFRGTRARGAKYLVSIVVLLDTPAPRGQVDRPGRLSLKFQSR